MSSSKKSGAVSPEVLEAEERTQTALRLQRKQRLEALVQKRKANVNYLKKVHLGGSFWLNIMHLSTENIRDFVLTTVPKQRVVGFYYLGLSVESLLSQPVGAKMISSFSQLMEEFEYFCAGTAMQGVKSLMAKNSACLYPQTMNADVDEILSRPSIYKFQNSVVFEQLKTPHLAFELDYIEVLIGLCGGLCKLYDNIFCEECYM